MTDFSEADEYLDKYEDNFEIDFNSLTRGEQGRVILDCFFESRPQYLGDAEILRDGINYTRRITDLTNFQKILRKGKEYRVRRNRQGRFVRWLR